MQQDFSDFITQLNRNNAEFVIIGGVALAFYGFPRYTGDLDIWIQPTLDNVKKVFKTIEDFFNSKLVVSPEDFLSGNNMITLGEEPVQIQIHLNLDGVTPDEIWAERIRGRFGENDVFYIGKNVFIKNKKTVGRDQDIIDIKKIIS